MLVSRAAKAALLALVLIAGGMLSQNAAFAASQTQSQVSCTSLGGAGANWTTPELAASSDNAYATASVDATTTDPLQCLNYGFSIPAGATILGIEVNVERRSSATPGSEDASVRLVQGGTIAGSDLQTATAYTTADAVETHGSPTQLWGLTWTPAAINAWSAHRTPTAWPAAAPVWSMATRPASPAALATRSIWANQSGEIVRIWLARLQ